MLRQLARPFRRGGVQVDAESTGTLFQAWRSASRCCVNWHALSACNYPQISSICEPLNAEFVVFERAASMMLAAMHSRDG